MRTDTQHTLLTTPSGRHAGSQSTSPGAALKTHAATLPALSASIPPTTPLAGKLLWTYKEFGQRLGVSERKAHDLAKELALVPVELGPRCVRLVPSECEAALARLPRKVAPTEPHQLLRGKVEKLKRTGVAA